MKIASLHSGCTSPFKRPRKDSQTLCSKRGENWVPLQQMNTTVSWRQMKTLHYEWI